MLFNIPVTPRTKATNDDHDKAFHDHERLYALLDGIEDAASRPEGEIRPLLESLLRANGHTVAPTAKGGTRREGEGDAFSTSAHPGGAGTGVHPGEDEDLWEFSFDDLEPPAKPSVRESVGEAVSSQPAQGRLPLLEGSNPEATLTQERKRVKRELPPTLPAEMEAVMPWSNLAAAGPIEAGFDAALPPGMGENTEGVTRAYDLLAHELQRCNTLNVFTKGAEDPAIDRLCAAPGLQTRAVLEVGGTGLLLLNRETMEVVAANREVGILAEALGCGDCAAGITCLHQHLMTQIAPKVDAQPSQLHAQQSLLIGIDGKVHYTQLRFICNSHDSKEVVCGLDVVVNHGGDRSTRESDPDSLKALTPDRLKACWAEASLGLQARQL